MTLYVLITDLITLDAAFFSYWYTSHDVLAFFFSKLQRPLVGGKNDVHDSVIDVVLDTIIIIICN